MPVFGKGKIDRQPQNTIINAILFYFGYEIATEEPVDDQRKIHSKHEPQLFGSST
jgi:hypothetical protein